MRISITGVVMVSMMDRYGVRDFLYSKSRQNEDIFVGMTKYLFFKLNSRKIFDDICDIQKS